MPTDGPDEPSCADLLWPYCLESKLKYNTPRCDLPFNVALVLTLFRLINDDAGLNCFESHLLVKGIVVDRASDKGIIVTVTLIMALLVASAGLIYSNTHRLDQDAGWVAHTYAVLDLAGHPRQGTEASSSPARMSSCNPLLPCRLSNGSSGRKIREGCNDGHFRETGWAGKSGACERCGAEQVSTNLQGGLSAGWSLSEPCAHMPRSRIRSPGNQRQGAPLVRHSFSLPL